MLDNQRANLYGLVVSGKLLVCRSSQLESHPEASGTRALRRHSGQRAKPNTAIERPAGGHRSYKKNGVPADLVEVAKRREVADANSKQIRSKSSPIEWSDAVAVEGRLASPDSETGRDSSGDGRRRESRRCVSIFDFDHVITVAQAVPKNLGKVQLESAAAGRARERNKLTIQHHDPLPAWAIAAFKNVQVPKQSATPSDHDAFERHAVDRRSRARLAHGRRVGSDQLERADSSAEGQCKASPNITAQLLPFGTTTYDRIALRKQLDDIAADVRCRNANSR